MSQADNPVVFVGAGPGDPELVTVAGKKALEQADLVLYAGSLVSKEMLTWCKAGALAQDTAGMDLDQMTEAMIAAQREGRKVVRLHTGDPSLYGATWEQMRRLAEARTPYRVIPGVTAAFAAAAGLGLEYTMPELCQTLMLTRAAGRTPVPEREDLASLAAHGSSMAIYLSVGQAEEVSRVLSQAHGPDAPVVIAYRVSWPQERFIWTTAAELPAAFKDNGIARQALILAGPTLAVLAGRGRAAESKLYDPGFSHGFRQGREAE